MLTQIIAQGVHNVLKRDADEVKERPQCTAKDDNDEHTPARISAIFVVLVASGFGAFFPVLSSKYSMIRLPPWCFFIAKFFGSGVIVATAFIHLMQPANESLSNECLGGVFEDYPMAFAIALMSLFAMFLGELITHALVGKKLDHLEPDFARGQVGGDGAHLHSHFGDESLIVDGRKEVPTDPTTVEQSKLADQAKVEQEHDTEISGLDSDAISSVQNYYPQLVAIFILEFGILFHSVWVGLALSVSGDEFVSLYIVVVFHQLFEGLGLGSRIAMVDWPQNRRWTPWVLCTAYMFVTPIAIAIGLGVRTTYDTGSRKALITNGVFDSISAGILFYAGLVELMAHEFFYSGQFKGKDGAKKSLLAYLVMAIGAGLMALLGKWA